MSQKRIGVQLYLTEDVWLEFKAGCILHRQVPSILVEEFIQNTLAGWKAAGPQPETQGGANDDKEGHG